MIGQTIWRFDINRRKYDSDPRSPSSGSPIYREHWVPITVFGETPHFWLAGNKHFPCRVHKEGPRPGYAFTEQEVDDACWVNKHRGEIVQNISGLRDVETLRRIAEIIGMESK